MDRSLTTGGLLSQIFRVFFANFASFGVLTALVLSPAIILNMIAISRKFLDLGGNTTPMEVIANLLTVLLGPLLSGALTFGVFQHLRGKPASIGVSLKQGLRSVLGVVAVSLIAGVFVMIGFLLLIIPGIIIATILAVAVPVAVIEDPSAMDALARSRDLTRGYRWPIFFTNLGLGLLGMIVTLILAMVGANSRPVLVVGSALVLVLFSGLQGVAPAIIYHGLRRVKEAVDVEELAAVFD